MFPLQSAQPDVGIVVQDAVVSTELFSAPEVEKPRRVGSVMSTAAISTLREPVGILNCGTSGMTISTTTISSQTETLEDRSSATGILEDLNLPPPTFTRSRLYRPTTLDKVFPPYDKNGNQSRAWAAVQRLFIKRQGQEPPSWHEAVDEIECLLQRRLTAQEWHLAAYIRDSMYLVLYHAQLAAVQVAGRPRRKPIDFGDPVIAGRCDADSEHFLPQSLYLISSKGLKTVASLLKIKMQSSISPYFYLSVNIYLLIPC